MHSRSDQSLRVHCSMHTQIDSKKCNGQLHQNDMIFTLKTAGIDGRDFEMFVSCTLHEYDLENMIFRCCSFHFWNTCGCIMQHFLMIQYFFSRLLYLVQMQEINTMKYYQDLLWSICINVITCRIQIHVINMSLTRLFCQF